MANEYEPDETTDISRQLKSAEQLPAGLMLLKMENESMMSVARAAPRDQGAIIKQLSALIESYPAAADDSIYRKPVGSVSEGTCVKCGIRYELPYKNDDIECPGCGCRDVKQREKTMKYAEGLSIRAAESIRAIYGCNRLSVSTEQLADGAVRIAATFVDYAGCNMTSDDAIVSPWYKSKGGGMTRTPEDRFLNLVVKAAKSKLVRDVILDAVPNNIKAAFREMCERKLAGLLPPEVVDQKIIPNFQKIGLSVEHLEKLLGNKPKALGWTEQDRIQLQQIYGAIIHKETSVGQILRDLAPDEPAKTGGTNGNGNAQAGQGTVQGSDLTKGPKKQDKPQEAKPDPVVETKPAPAETKEPQTETKPAGGEPSAEEMAEIRTEEAYGEIYSAVKGAKSESALNKVSAAVGKDESIGKEARGVIHAWIARRREAIKAGNGQKSML